MEKKQLTLRHKKQRAKPTFRQQEAHVLKRLEGGWRVPRGKSSKTRRRVKGRGKRPSIGYGVPAATRHLTKDGRRLIRIASVNDLSKLDPKTDTALIASAVGKRLRTQLMKTAEERKIPVKN
ncbi:MAG: 50S ribosomal protein L32e [Nanoarchaeota archaeon]|nr:50S ribosomal protein L32e [Nanoarchaeota archaeon]